MWFAIAEVSHVIANLFKPENLSQLTDGLLQKVALIRATSKNASAIRIANVSFGVRLPNAVSQELRARLPNVVSRTASMGLSLCPASQLIDVKYFTLRPQLSMMLASKLEPTSANNYTGFRPASQGNDARVRLTVQSNLMELFKPPLAIRVQQRKPIPLNIRVQ